MILTDEARPPDSLERYDSLDFLRGCAVMGILAMNITAFAMPETAYINPAAYGGADSGNIAAWLFGFLFFDGKMRGLFSLLFGASMMVIIIRATNRGEDAGKGHFTRMLWLVLFGLAHFFLIWWGDILFRYAATGAAAYLFHHLSPRKLIKWGLIFYAAGFLTFSIVSGVMMYSQYEANQPGVSVSALKEYRALQKDMGGDPAEIASDIALHRGSYTQIVQHKIDDQLFDPLIGLLGALFETLPLMLIGMGMAQNGFITGQGTAGQYRKWTFWAGGGGLLLTGICAYINYRSGFDPVTVMAVEMAATQPGRILMTIGYAALLILIVRRFAHSGLLQRIMAAGRAAFTNYLGTSILMTTLFYGYGLGLYGHIGRAQLYLFVLAAWAVMLFWSKPWLVHFHYGPLEWLWRSLARGRLQPFGRNGAPPPPD